MDSKAEISDIPEDILQICWEVCYQEDSCTYEEVTRFNNLTTAGKKRTDVSKDTAISEKRQRKRSLIMEDIPDMVMVFIPFCGLK